MPSTTRTFGVFIDGQQRTSDGERSIDVINPATLEVVATVPDASKSDVDSAVRAAASAYSSWRGTTHKERSEVLRKIAHGIRARADELVEVEASEVGRPVGELRVVDIPETADCFDYYASAIRVVHGKSISVAGPYVDFAIYEPLGVVGAIVPWNFPLNLASWKVAPALAMGNAIVLKPSELTPSTAMILGQIAIDAGLPPGILNVVPGYGATAGSWIVEHPAVDMVTFTGGVQTGRIVAEAAGRNGKRVSLELGGKSAQIVFADCDLDAAAAGVLEGIFFAAGENCCAGSRVLVEASVRGTFLERLRSLASKLVIGPPNQDTTQLGCLISLQHLERVRSFVDGARDIGAEIVECCDVPRELAGKPFMAPTLVLDPPAGSRIVTEEVFGPVLAINSFQHETEAIAAANATKFDLAAGIWTNDATRGQRVARELRAGTVWINTYNRIFNDAPFGGHRGSGFGRDLGMQALSQYSNIKNICQCTSPGSDKWFSV